MALTVARAKTLTLDQRNAMAPILRRLGAAERWIVSAGLEQLVELADQAMWRVLAEGVGLVRFVTDPLRFAIHPSAEIGTAVRSDRRDQVAFHVLRHTGQLDTQVALSLPRSVWDLSPLRGLSALRELTVRTADLTPVADLNIERLVVKVEGSVDYTPVAYCDSLRELDLRGIDALSADLTPLARCGHLTKLQLPHWRAGGADLAPLADLPPTVTIIFEPTEDLLAGLPFDLSVTGHEVLRHVQSIRQLLAIHTEASHAAAVERAVALADEQMWACFGDFKVAERDGWPTVDRGPVLLTGAAILALRRRGALDELEAFHVHSSLRRHSWVASPIFDLTGLDRHPRLRRLSLEVDTRAMEADTFAFERFPELSALEELRVYQSADEYSPAHGPVDCTFLLKLPQLNHLIIHANSLDFQNFPTHPALEDVKIIAKRVALSELPALRSLTIEADAVDGLEALMRSPNLRTVQIRCSRKAIPTLTALRRLRALHSVTLDAAEINDPAGLWEVGADGNAAVSSVINLTVSVGVLRLGPRGPLDLRVLLSARNLEHLTLIGSCATLDLAPLSELQTLRTVVLKGNDWTAAQLDALGNARFTLDLWGCLPQVSATFAPHGLRVLGPIPRFDGCARVRALGVWPSQLADDAKLEQPALRGYSCLETLEISGHDEAPGARRADFFPAALRTVRLCGPRDDLMNLAWIPMHVTRLDVLNVASLAGAKALTQLETLVVGSRWEVLDRTSRPGRTRRLRVWTPLDLTQLWPLLRLRALDLSACATLSDLSPLAELPVLAELRLPAAVDPARVEAVLAVASHALDGTARVYTLVPRAAVTTGPVGRVVVRMEGCGVPYVDGNIVGAPEFGNDVTLELAPGAHVLEVRTSLGKSLARGRLDMVEGADLRVSFTSTGAKRLLLGSPGELVRKALPSAD